MPKDGTSYRQADVRCPFYRSDNGTNRIMCEGIIAGGCLSHFFRTKALFCETMDKFCCDKYRDCPVYCANLAKY